MKSLKMKMLAAALAVFGVLGTSAHAAEFDPTQSVTAGIATLTAIVGAVAAFSLIAILAFKGIRYLRHG